MTGLPLSRGVSSVNSTDDSGKIKSHGDFFLSSPNRKRLTNSLLGDEITGGLDGISVCFMF